MSKAYLSLGSNIGNREGYLRAAVKIIKANKSIRVTKTSSLYETDAVGHTPQRRFLNIVAEIETPLSARELLMVCQFVEEFLKRKRNFKWGPRTIDVDILLYGQQRIREAGLIIPHPEMVNRAFVMVPLFEIAPNVDLPNGTRVASCLKALPVKSIERVGDLDI